MVPPSSHFTKETIYMKKKRVYRELLVLCENLRENVRFYNSVVPVQIPFHKILRAQLRFFNVRQFIGNTTSILLSGTMPS